MLSKLNEGDVVEGIIKNLTDYGAFIDLGGLDGLLHITDISWKRLKSNIHLSYLILLKKFKLKLFQLIMKKIESH